jgi:hypothetical protein
MIDHFYMQVFWVSSKGSHDEQIQIIKKAADKTA